MKQIVGLARNHQINFVEGEDGEKEPLAVAELIITYMDGRKAELVEGEVVKRLNLKEARMEASVKQLEELKEYIQDCIYELEDIELRNKAISE